MKFNKKYLFIVYFIIFYTIISFILLKTIANPLVNLWVFLINSIFKNYFNYAAFIFVPICSGVISKSIYLSIILSIKIAFKTKIKIKWVLLSIIFIWVANLLRILIVLFVEKTSYSLAKTTHIVFWFIMGLIILGLSLKTIKKEKNK